MHRENKIASELKKAKLFSFPKSTDKTNPTNYRPISLLSVLSKLLKKHVHIYFNDYLEKRQLLHPFQSGFRRKYSCKTALARLTNSWLTAMNKFEVSGVVFLNLKKTFDLVDHDILLKKLAIYLKTQVLYHFLNHSFIIERNASYSMALTPLKSQLSIVYHKVLFWDLFILVSLSMTFYYT